MRWQGALKAATHELKNIEQECDSERQELQHQMQQLNEEIERWGRQTQDRNIMLSNRIDKEVESRKVRNIQCDL